MEEESLSNQRGIYSVLPIVLPLAAVALIIAIVIGMVSYLTRPWWQKEGFVLSDSHIVTDGFYTARLDYYAVQRGAFNSTEVVIETPGQAPWYVMNFGDTGYGEAFVDGKFIFTAAIYQIEGQAWVIVDPVARTVSYSDEMPTPVAPATTQPS